eukprot:COSAG01_NODE_9117_length_2546_cov_12.248393_1_plen_109_part_00
MNRNVGKSQPLLSVLIMANSTVPLVAGQPEVLVQLEALMELRELEAGSLLTAKGEEAAREMYFVVRNAFRFVFNPATRKVNSWCATHDAVCCPPHAEDTCVFVGFVCF